MRGRRTGGARFLERTLRLLADAFEYAGAAETIAGKPAFLQSLDPRVKLIGSLLLVGTAVMSHRLSVTFAILAGAAALGTMSRIPLGTLAVRVWLTVLLFTGPIALPAVFLTPGEPVAILPQLHWEATDRGIRTATLLVARAETAATLLALLVLTTPWTHVLKALRVLRVPIVFVAILGMTHRYIFVLLRMGSEMLEARRSRLIGRLGSGEQRRLAVGGAALLFSRSFILSNEIHLAMQARGFRGEFHTIDRFRMEPLDWTALVVSVLAAVTLFWLGR